MENLPLIDLVATDIDNPKNVLRLHSDIEHKFDRFLLTFVPSGDALFFSLDPSIKNSQRYQCHFENIDGRPLYFRAVIVMASHPRHSLNFGASQS
jgi:hypothetical protein